MLDLNIITLMCNMQYNITSLINSLSSPLMTNTQYIYEVLFAKHNYQILDQGN